MSECGGRQKRSALYKLKDTPNHPMGTVWIMICYVSSPYFSSSLPFVTQIRGHIHNRHFSLSPPAFLLRCAPSFPLRTELSIFFPRRLSSKRTYTRCFAGATYQVVISAQENVLWVDSNSRNRPYLVITRFNHYQYSVGGDRYSARTGHEDKHQFQTQHVTG